VFPFRVCGEGAEIVGRSRDDRRVKGVAALPPLRTSCRPEGLVANVRLTVWGWSVTLAVLVRPPESVAVKTSSRLDGYSWSGAVNEPLATPTKS
jgi:hypothetical protein